MLVARQSLLLHLYVCLHRRVHFEYGLKLKRLLLVGVFTCFVMTAFGQKEIPNLEKLDVLHYDFQIAISDTSNEIHGVAQIEVQFLKNQQALVLDFVQKRADDKGMEVVKILENETNISYEQLGEQLIIQPEKTIEKGTIHRWVAGRYTW